MHRFACNSSSSRSVTILHLFCGDARDLTSGSPSRLTVTAVARPHAMSASPTRRTASPDADPGARWQQIREEWLARPAPASNNSAVIDGDDSAASTSAGTTTTTTTATPQGQPKSKRGRDPVFQQRIATLEQLLREANALATGTSPAKLSIAQPRPPDLDTAVVPSLAQPGSAGSAALNGAQPEEPEEEEEPDGGMPIRDHGAQGDPTHELKKVSEVWPCPQLRLVLTHPR